MMAAVLIPTEEIDTLLGRTLQIVSQSYSSALRYVLELNGVQTEDEPQ